MYPVISRMHLPLLLTQRVRPCTQKCYHKHCEGAVQELNTAMVAMPGTPSGLPVALAAWLPWYERNLTRPKRRICSEGCPTCVAGKLIYADAQPINQSVLRCARNPAPPSRMASVYTQGFPPIAYTICLCFLPSLWSCS